MTELLKRIPGVSQLKSLLSQKTREQCYEMLVKSTLYKEWTKKQSYLPPPMLSETRQMLLDRFGQSNRKLSQLIGRDLSHWLE